MKSFAIESLGRGSAPRLVVFNAMNYQDSLDRDAELDGRDSQIETESIDRDIYVMETGLERDTALSAAIDQIEPGQQIDYTEYFKQIVSGQFDYRPYLMRLLRTQGYMEEKP